MITNENSRAVYTGDGQSKQFTVPFSFFTNAAGVYGKKNQISVFVADADGAEKLLDEDKDYQVDGATVVLPEALPADKMLVILRDVPLTQDLDLLDGREIKPEVLEKQLDKVTMALQEMHEKLSRAVVAGVNVEDDLTPTEMIAQIRGLYEDIKNWTDACSEEAKKAIDAAVSAYEQAEKLYASVEYYTAGTPALNYTGDLQTFKVLDAYKADGMTLKVFVNGMLKRRGETEDYVEIINPELSKGGDLYGDTVVFNTPLNTGDKLVFMFSDTLTMPGGEVAQAAALAAENAEKEADRAEKEADRAQACADTFIPRQVGQVYYSQSNRDEYNLGAVPGWTGETKTKAEVPALWDFVQKHPERQISAQEYETMLAEKKTVPFYVVDGANQTLRLPIYSRFIGGVQDDGQIGAYTDTVRAFEGVFSSFDRQKSTDAPDCSGMFKVESRWSASVKGGNGDGWGTKVKMDSTLGGENFAGKETAPAHAREYPWIVAYNKIEGLLEYNGGVIRVKGYTEAQWNAMEEKPQNELSLIEETIV